MNKDYINGLDADEKLLLNAPQKGQAEKIRQLKKRIRNEQKKENVPRLVLYCVDKDSTAEAVKTRAPLNTNVDVLGLEIFVPGQRAANDVFTSAVQIK